LSTHLHVYPFVRPLFTIVCATLVFSGCATSPVATAPPWQEAALTNVPSVFRAEWQNAANRSTCALVAFAATGEATRDAVPRRANFSGGWAVAWDLPTQRSAFGIAGTGTTWTGDTHQWPDTIVWSDGSRATWGLEGGTGPNHLAYVTITGQGCLYNVWSALGEDHLRYLLGQIRFVSL
jgi:hypothetical protein